MARKPRIQFKGAFYHVYNRGNRRDLIFLKKEDYVCFEKFLFEEVARSKIRLSDWSLIPNHFHLLVETPHANLAEFMQRFLTRYAMYFNWKYKMVGHVFQGRYGARLCDKEAYFLALIQYIELNPYRLKKNRVLAEPGTWKWTALRFLMGQEEPPEVCREPLDEVLRRFGRTREEARVHLIRFLKDGLARDDWEEFYQPDKNGFLGDEDFAQTVQAEIEKPVPPNVSWPATFNILLERAAECFQISTLEICGPSEMRSLSRIRQALIIIGREKCSFTTRAMAAVLKRGDSAVSMVLRRCYKKAPLRETEQLERALKAARS